MAEILVAGGWSVFGAVVAVIVLRWLRGEGQRAKALDEAEERQEVLETWPPSESFQFVAEKCVLQADGRFTVAFVCINRSELTWNIRRSVLTHLRSDKGAMLSSDIEDNSIHQSNATTLPPGSLVRTVFQGRLDKLDPQEWSVGNAITLYMGQGWAPQHKAAGHLVVYGEAVEQDVAVPFRALDSPVFTLMGRVQA